MSMQCILALIDPARPALGNHAGTDYKLIVLESREEALVVQ